MGHGSYSTNRATLRSETLNYENKSVKEVFRQEETTSEMDPEGVQIRESRDSDEHPESVAIVMGLDVTASMGHIPKELITSGLTNTMGSIIERGVEDPQVLFLGIGDHLVDRSPLQVAQFESSDPLLDKWLKEVWLESGGGGNGGESYLLAWYFAANHTSIDCFEKRDQKGILFTIGDEPPHGDINQSALQQIMGDACSAEGTLTAGELLEDAREMYEVKHIHLTETSTGKRDNSINSWKELMRDDVIFLDDHREIPKVMAKTILEITQEGEGTTVSPNNSNENEDEVIL